MYFAFWNRFRFVFCPVCELFLSFMFTMLFYDFYINFAVVICEPAFSVYETLNTSC